MAAGKGKLPKRTAKPPAAPPQKAKKPVGYGQHGTPFYNIEKYNQSKSGRAHAAAAKAGHPLSQKPVGYGEHGKAFFNVAKYEASKAGRAAKGHLGGGGIQEQPLSQMPGHPSQNATHYHGPATTGAIKPGAIKAPRMK